MADTLSKNANYGSIALIIGPVGFAGLGWIAPQLVSMLILFFGIMTFGVWAFLDEMGLENPLNKMGTVAFGFAVFGFLNAQVGPQVTQNNYVLLYDFGAFLALFFWSAAFLHRGGAVRKVGAVGLLAGVLPLVLLIVGHVAVGFGGAIGVVELWQAVESGQVADPLFLQITNTVVGVWMLGAAVLMHSGAPNPH
ncbi:MAG: hypothetical protein QNK92_14430 [Amylibacter sp.]